MIEEILRFLKIGNRKEVVKNGAIVFNAEQDSILRDVLGDKYEAALKAANNEAAQEQLSAALKKITDQEEALRTAEQKIEILSAMPEGKEAVAVIVGGGGTGLLLSSKHLFGIQHDIFSLDKRWNRNAKNRKASDEKYTPEDRDLFKKDFDAYTKEVSERYKYLVDNNLLHSTIQKNAGFTFTELETKFGAEYLVRRQDALITYIRTLDSVRSLFPVRSNVNDVEVVVNAFEGDSFTQAYQAGSIFAGSFEFTPETYKGYELMFKFKFEIKNLEKEYIGYLNKEGSNPMKWSFIEWVMARCAEIQTNEENRRRISGVRVNSTVGKAAYYIYGSNGLLQTARIGKDENRIYHIDTLNTYNYSTILVYVENFVDTVFKLLDGNMSGYKLLMNKIHVPMFLQAYAKEYGPYMDYTGAKLEVQYYGLKGIVSIPNMGNSYLMLLVKDNAIEWLENKPGDAFRYYYQQNLEELYIASWYAEGCHVFAGRAYASKALLLASGAKHTQCFANHPVTMLLADATTVDASINSEFQTIANTGATAITDITNAVKGVAYRIYCGSATNATSIAKTNKFSTITAAYTPTAVGDFIEVIYDSANSKFIELRRKVGGTVTVNASAAAPELV